MSSGIGEGTTHCTRRTCARHWRTDVRMRRSSGERAGRPAGFLPNIGLVLPHVPRVKIESPGQPESGHPPEADAASRGLDAQQPSQGELSESGETPDL